jgi:hypothetical protein
MDIYNYEQAVIIIAAYLVHYFYGNIFNLRPLSQKQLVCDRATCTVHILFPQKSMTGDCTKFGEWTSFYKH